ncbi:MAG: methyl-accepting chemotaxis protein [Pseudomonas sp.]
MEQVVVSMRAIQSSAEKMASIVDTIDSIAFQTNILALNASVEAARAGEQGRGFAVVAGEVRNLASRSADAAREIKTLIGSAGEQVRAGNLRVEEAGAVIRGVVTDMGRLNTLIGEISSASNEQSHGIEQINVAVAEMDQMTQRNARLVQDSAASSSCLDRQSERLKEHVASFTINNSGRSQNLH